MGEEVRPDDVVSEWEDGLPAAEDLTPLSQSLVPPELASAFKISPETPRTAVDVHRASETTLSTLRYNPFADPDDMDEPDPDPDPKKARRDDELKDLAAEEDQSASKNSKKPRLVWTPQLHKRFIEVVAHLGLKTAVPKTIMRLMNVDGLTRENVASHLQKYRLFVRRKGYSDDGPLPTDHGLFASAQPSLAESSNANNNTNNNSNTNGGGMGNGNGGNNHHSYGHTMGISIPMPYHHHHPQMMQMPTMPSNGHGFHTYHHHNQQQHSGMLQRQSDWPGNSSNYNKHLNHTFQDNQ